jgi:hypothetical protein
MTRTGSGSGQSAWIPLDQAVDDVFTKVITDGVAATAIVAAAQALSRPARSAANGSP